MIHINKKSVLVYGLYGIFICLFFIYYLFPNTLMQNYLSAKVSETIPSLELSLNSVTPTPVIGLYLENIALSLRNNPRVALNLADAKVKVGLFDLLKGNTRLYYQAAGYQGNIKGSILHDSFLSTKGNATTDVAFQSLAVDKCTLLQDLLARHVTGTLSGTMAFNGRFAKWTEGKGNLHFNLINGTYPLNEPVVGIDKLDFKRIDAKMELKDGTLRISKIDLTGQGFFCSLQGDILIDKNRIKQSSLNLKGKMELQSAGNKKISFTITGTFEDIKTIVM